MEAPSKGVSENNATEPYEQVTDALILQYVLTLFVLRILL